MSFGLAMEEKFVFETAVPCTYGAVGNFCVIGHHNNSLFPQGSRYNYLDSVTTTLMTCELPLGGLVAISIYDMYFVNTFVVTVWCRS